MDSLTGPHSPQFQSRVHSVSKCEPASLRINNQWVHRVTQAFHPRVGAQEFELLTCLGEVLACEQIHLDMQAAGCERGKHLSDDEERRTPCRNITALSVKPRIWSTQS